MIGIFSFPGVTEQFFCMWILLLKVSLHVKSNNESRNGVCPLGDNSLSGPMGYTYTTFWIKLIIWGTTFGNKQLNMSSLCHQCNMAYSYTRMKSPQEQNYIFLVKQMLLNILCLLSKVGIWHYKDFE